MHKKAMGQYGEKLAASYLASIGYRVIQLNWRYRRYGELDIIAYSEKIRRLSIVEVKTRTSDAFGAPLEALSPRQQKKIRFLTEIYLSQSLDLPCYEELSFDLITVVTGNNFREEPRITHYPAVF